jgi:ribose transport system substrate-binding protein
MIFRKMAVVAAMASAGLALATGAWAKEPYKIYLSMSYIGNDWQAEAANMFKAMATSKEYKDRVETRIQVAGPNAQKQIQQINAMVQAGANAIVVYPISPTALNEAIKNACDRGVVIVTYDSQVTEPCAYQVHIDQYEAGRQAAQYLADKIGGKGNIVYITGVPGTSVDTARTKAANDVFAKYPGIKVIATANGMWSQAVARTELSKILATSPWSQIDALLMQVGCYTANSMESESGIPDDKIKPCAGEAPNGFRVQMLPKSVDVPGANGTYRPMGAPGISVSSQTFTAATALKVAVDVLDGKKVDHNHEIFPKQVTSDAVKLCETGSWEEMKAGCNAFPASLVPNPGWFASIFSDELPEVGFNAALTGTPED